MYDVENSKIDSDDYGMIFCIKANEKVDPFSDECNECKSSFMFEDVECDE